MKSVRAWLSRWIQRRRLVKGLRGLRASGLFKGEPSIVFDPKGDWGYFSKLKEGLEDDGEWPAARAFSSVSNNWIFTSDLSGHIFCFGSTGSGKSMISSFLISQALAGMSSHEDPPGWLLAQGFNERARSSRSLKGWGLSADEALDERHGILLMAFSRACERWESGSDAEAEAQRERLAEQIARRCLGLPSEAPDEHWLNGFFEEGACWPRLRQSAKIKLEALALSQEMSAPKAGLGAAARRRAL